MSQRHHTDSEVKHLEALSPPCCRLETAEDVALYCSIPPCEITGEQLSVFLFIQFGIEVEIPIIRTNQNGNLYCFLRCKNKKAYEKLVKELDYKNNVTLPDNTLVGYDDIPGTNATLCERCRSLFCTLLFISFFS